MKTIYLISALLLISIVGYSQQNTKIKMVLVKMSSDVLKDGSCTIKLDTTLAESEYFIFTTPIEKPLDLYIAKKEKTYFLVKSNTNDSGTFDYVVYVKQTLITDKSKLIKK